MHLLYEGSHSFSRSYAPIHTYRMGLVSTLELQYCILPLKVPKDFKINKKLKTHYEGLIFNQMNIINWIIIKIINYPNEDY